MTGFNVAHISNEHKFSRYMYNVISITFLFTRCFLKHITLMFILVCMYLLTWIEEWKVGKSSCYFSWFLIISQKWLLRKCYVYLQAWEHAYVHGSWCLRLFVVYNGFQLFPLWIRVKKILQRECLTKIFTYSKYSCRFGHNKYLKYCSLFFKDFFFSYDIWDLKIWYT